MGVLVARLDAFQTEFGTVAARTPSRSRRSCVRGARASNPLQRSSKTTPENWRDCEIDRSYL